MQLSHKSSPHNKIDYYPLRNGLVDVFLHKNEMVELDEEENEVFVAEEIYFQVDKSTRLKDIEDNFENYWKNKGEIKPIEISQEERIEILEDTINFLLGL